MDMIAFSEDEFLSAVFARLGGATPPASYLALVESIVHGPDEDNGELLAFVRDVAVATCEVLAMAHPGIEVVHNATGRPPGGDPSG